MGGAVEAWECSEVLRVADSDFLGAAYKGVFATCSLEVLCALASDEEVVACGRDEGAEVGVVGEDGRVVVVVRSFEVLCAWAVVGGWWAVRGSEGGAVNCGVRVRAAVKGEVAVVGGAALRAAGRR